jgi:hypothetical protein
MFVERSLVKDCAMVFRKVNENANKKHSTHLSIATFNYWHDLDTRSRRSRDDGGAKAVPVVQANVRFPGSQSGMLPCDVETRGAVPQK